MYRGDNSIYIQGRIIVLRVCHSAHCNLYINQVSFKSFLYFPRCGADRHPLLKTVKGDNSINIQCMMIMVLKFCPPSQLHLSINQVPINDNNSFKVFAGQGSGRTARQTDKATDICFPLWGA